MAIYSSQTAWVLLAVAAILPFAYGSDGVLDVLGHPVVAGTEYTILPVNGGGLSLKMRNNSCPMYVAYNNNGESPPVIFTPSKFVKVITEGADVKVEFSAATICVQSTRWRIRSDSELNKSFIYAGTSTPSSRIDSAYFRITKSIESGESNVYELSFCPTSVCSYCRLACGSLGIYADNNGNQWLVKDGEINPLKVQFQRA